MLRKAMVFLVTLLVVSPSAYAQEKFTVSGEVIFPKNADIYMELRTQAEQGKDKRPLRPRFLIIKLTPEQKKAKRVSFNFVGVPKGTYCIKAFQDVNKNTKLDFVEISFGLPKPIEPNGFYKPSWPAEWNNIKFEVGKDITRIKVELRLGPV